MLEAERPLNFQKMKAVSDQFILNLSKELQEKLFDGLTQVNSSLNTEPILAATLYAFGEIQEARLKRAYSYFSKVFFNKEIEIIDYSCGQGVAEMVYHDFLYGKSLSQKIGRITLIDSSEIALKRASLHTKLVFPDVEIRVVCKKMNELKTADVISKEKSTKLHLLTNFPGMDAEAMIHLSKVLKAGLSGSNYFICLSPFYGYSSDLLKQMNTFTEIMNPDQQFRYSEDLDAIQFIPGKPWTCSLRIFIKDEHKDGEFIQEKNIKYWITRDDVRYNEDKTALVKCPRSMAGEYILPNTVTTIAPKAFRGCENLSMIIADNSHFINVDGILYSRDMSCLVKYPQSKSGNRFVVPDCVSTIEPYAFAGCVQLEEIILPKTLVALGFGAFECCIHLKDIIIPESVMQIEGSVFASCTSLSVVDFNPVNCESMENLEADDEGISCREALAFEGCTLLNTINIGSQVTMIPDFAFSFCEYIHSIVLPESVAYIGRNTFSYCKQLEEITLTASITSIGKDAFFWCKNLRAIWVPKGMSLYFNKFTALKDFASCIKEEGDEEDKQPTSPRVYDAIAAAVESIEDIEQGAFKSSEQEVSAVNKGTLVTHLVRDMSKIERKESEEGIALETNSLSGADIIPMKEAIVSLPEYYERENPVQEQDEPILETAILTQTNLPASDSDDEVYKEQQVNMDDPVICRMHELAEQGNAKIQNKLGYLYEVGDRVEPDAVEAVKWYRKAAEQGYAKAQFNLAKQYALGVGVVQSDSETLKWYLMAANQGLVNAMNNVGAMYATGRGVERDESKAIEWYQKAAQKGDAIAIRNLQKRGIEI